MSAGGMSARDLTVAVAAASAGCTFARKVVDAGRPVSVTDCQHNLSAFSSVIRGHLHEISIPTSQAARAAGHITGKGA